jgi:hypothetical protein
MKALLTTAKLTALTFAVSMSFLPATAFALPQYDRVVTYFESPTGGQVGQYVKNCTGATSSWGEVTPYFTVEETLCSPDPIYPCQGWPPGQCPFG